MGSVDYRVDVLVVGLDIYRFGGVLLWFGPMRLALLFEFQLLILVKDVKAVEHGVAEFLLEDFIRQELLGPACDTRVLNQLVDVGALGVVHHEHAFHKVL